MLQAGETTKQAGSGDSAETAVRGATMTAAGLAHSQGTTVVVVTRDLSPADRAPRPGYGRLQATRGPSPEASSGGAAETTDAS
jgi:hypothetical protein